MLNFYLSLFLLVVCLPLNLFGQYNIEQSYYSHTEDQFVKTGYCYNAFLYSTLSLDTNNEKKQKFREMFSVNELGQLVEHILLGFSIDDKRNFLTKTVFQYDSNKRIENLTVMRPDKKIKWLNKTRNKKKFRERILQVNWANIEMEESYKYDSLGRLINLLHKGNKVIDTLSFSYKTTVSKNGQITIRYFGADTNLVTLDSFVHIQDSIFHFKPEIYLMSKGEKKTIKPALLSMKYYNHNRKRYLTKLFFNQNRPTIKFNKKGFPVIMEFGEYKYETRFFYDENDFITHRSNFRNGKFEDSILFDYEKKVHLTNNG